MQVLRRGHSQRIDLALLDARSNRLRSSSSLNIDTKVRVALAGKLPGIIPKFSLKKFNEFFLSIVISMLRDESPDVKTTFVENFSPIF